MEVTALELDASHTSSHGEAIDEVECAPEQEHPGGRVGVAGVLVSEGEDGRLASSGEREMIDGLDDGVRAVSPVDASGARDGAMHVDAGRRLDALEVEHLGP